MTLLKLVYNFFTKSAINEGVFELYKKCVAQARLPAFYQKGVPDTVEGRFDLILLHVYLVMRRLHIHKKENQQLFDLMFGDMDRSLREMGVGDMSIRKKMGPMISAFYGRSKAYEDAIDNNDLVLATTLKRNLLGKDSLNEALLQKLASYVRETIIKLDSQNDLALLSGQIDFVEPVL